MYNRPFYLEQMIRAKDSDFVKIITGVRRCGKSTLLMLFKDYLMNHGVQSEQIIEISYEKMTNDVLRDEKKLHEYIT